MVEAALVAVALALAACVVGLITFASAALTARKAAGAAETAKAAVDGELKAATANLAAQTARADDQQRKADALDHLLADAAVAGPVDGSYDRVLQGWRAIAKRHAPGADPGGVPVAGPAAAAPVSPDGLLRPGD